MTKRFVKVLAAAIVLATSMTAIAQQSAKKSLDRFYNKVNTVEAEFQQVVMDETLAPIQQSSGTLVIQRPGKFRWHYKQPFEQHIIGDGKRVWVYDVELKQVSSRAMDGALGQTPAILLAGKGSLSESFDVTTLDPRDGLAWVEMKPRHSDGGYSAIRVGFRKGVIRQLEMVDALGQTTRIVLAKVKENRKIKDDMFKFTPPEGVDVVGSQ